MFATLRGRRIEYQWIDGANPPIVFLHEGLGSLAMWKDFPARLASAANRSALVYSRYGYGNSDPLDAPRDPRYMHHEALESLPALLDHLAIERPVLFGHSDGASIALIHAGAPLRPVSGVIALAPHVMVEEMALEGIRRIRPAYERGLRDRLARYHADPDAAFFGWHDIWLDPRFRSWNIEEYLPAIACRLLAIQGLDDEYGTLDQIERIRKAAPQAETLALPDCRHSPHRDQPDLVIEAALRFLRV